MKSILTDLYYGRISPCERRRHISSEPEHNLLRDNITTEKKHLGEALSEENRKRLERLEEMYTAESDIENVEAFGAGFRLGVAIMLEVFDPNI